MHARSLVICFSAIASVASGQVTIGHNAGIAFSRWSVSGGSSVAAESWNNEQSAVPGLFFEVPVGIPLIKKLKLLTGLGFIQKGFQYKGADQEYRIGWVQLPVAVGMGFGNDRWCFTPALGAAFSKNMRGAYRYRYSDQGNWGRSPIGRPEDDGFFYRVPGYEWALQGRMAFDYQLKRSKVTVALGYQHGMSNMMFKDVPLMTDVNNPEGIPDAAVPDKALQRTLTFSLGYSLDLCQHSSSRVRDTVPDPEEIKPTRVSIGQRVGVSYASIAYTASLAEEQERVVDGAEPLEGLSTALVVNIRLGDHFSLQPEVAYTQRGWRSQWYPRPTTGNDLLRMNYLELPLLLRYAPFKGKWKPFVLTGPVAGRAVGGVHLVSIDSPFLGPISFTEHLSFGDSPSDGDYELFDLALLAGAGLVYKQGRAELFVDLRYQSSVTDFVPSGNHVQYSDDVTAKHRVWILSLGYLIPW